MALAKQRLMNRKTRYLVIDNRPATPTRVADVAERTPWCLALFGFAP